MKPEEEIVLLREIIDKQMEDIELQREISKRLMAILKGEAKEVK